MNRSDDYGQHGVNSYTRGKGYFLEYDSFDVETATNSTATKELHDRFCLY
jgi:hypothetical protein